MITRDYYLDLIHEGLQQLQIPQQPEGLYEPIRYTLESGGKRLRPMLTLAAAEALGLQPEKALNQALALETFHNFTLLHDDVMDEASVRRGHPTVHCRWNANTAILSGDAMLTLATVILAKDAGKVLPEALELFNATALEVYEGQQYDMEFERTTKVSVDDYINMIRLKTAVLIGCACKMGALMAGASAEVCNAFYAYGEKLGLAFQLRDDYLDTFGDPAIFGKSIGGDIICDKKTWLLITALNEDATGTVEKAIGSKMLPAEKIETVTGIYLSLGLDKRCNKLIDDYLDQALESLKSIGIDAEARKFFADIAERSRNRLN